MNKLLLATLLLSSTCAQAHHLPVRLMPATAGPLNSFHIDCRVAGDPETQVGNGVVPRRVADPAFEEPEQVLALQDDSEQPTGTESRLFALDPETQVGTGVTPR